MKDAVDMAIADETDQKIKLKQLKKSLEEKHLTINKLDEEILDKLEDESEIFEEIDEAGKFTQAIHEMTIKIDTALSETEVKNTEQPTNSTPSAHSGKSAKLPKLIIKRFKGEATEWQSFWDSFKSAVHDNASLSGIDKFNYLKSLVEGSAETTIAGLQLTEANYQAAINLLQRRYGDKQTILEQVMQDYRQPKKCHSHKKATVDNSDCKNEESDEEFHEKFEE
ncbi:hypothetical protein QZH41_012856, partial [Actinostola sp. cb2023]